ncbi:phosphate ABC transporter, permease protein PstA [candidate division WOR-3 bacterium JGI_Cruoil_03_44_89]|uniref:Phosphate transport system permease protein PstA n=1 Tax=candidate division WOR-3 bacterium JGI_Cruoil_03_44_89 TaxID=1973748 RepID=A0A235C0A8_UNCW3|nr:MAG: phosphate ABC transporter, permease protein PstA [candidate division WOR-3 bacterium JGI_Cruoil_03_44_89]
MKKRKIVQTIGFSLLYLSVFIAIFALSSILYFVIIKGAGVINWEFLTSMPKEGMTKGGIVPAILGTFYLATGAILFSLPLGIFAAIYLSEYAKQGRLVRIVRLGINNLSGVPSIVFGLFGLGIFVKFFGFGVSILSGALTLGILILPTIIRASEEALLAIPESFREASLALGATKWQTIKGVVLPNAIPGIMTGAILGVGRAAGETAPILFTATTFFCSRLPSSIFDEIQALPYHIYALMTEGTHSELQVPIAYGTTLVLISLVLLINLLAIIIRYKMRKGKKW